MSSHSRIIPTAMNLHALIVPVTVNSRAALFYAILCDLEHRSELLISGQAICPLATELWGRKGRHLFSELPTASRWTQSRTPWIIAATIKLISSISTQRTELSNNDNLLNRQTCQGYPVSHTWETLHLASTAGHGFWFASSNLTLHNKYF